MASFRATRELLLLSLDEEIVNEEEFLLLYDANTSTNLEFLHHQYDRFSLQDKETSECTAEFRFDKCDIPILADALRIPPKFKCPNGTVCDGIEGLCILLKRFAYPCRYSDMLPIFGRAVPELSMVCNVLTEWMYDEHGHRITNWNHNILSPIALQTYADVIHHKGAPLANCFGFVDGTVRPICQPGNNQRIVYNGHKRVHALKFQSI